MNSTFSITYQTKGKLPRLPFAMMKNAVLGESYELSLVVADEATMQELNRIHRTIDAPTDILSFPLDDSHGEIFINIPLSKKMAPDFGRDYENFIGFLFIHGLVHLKGYDHGSTMERIEAKYRAEFEI